jgi:hypothetical protein
MRGKLEVIILRPVFILYPEMEGEVEARAANPGTYRGVTASFEIDTTDIAPKVVRAGCPARCRHRLNVDKSACPVTRQTN